MRIPVVIFLALACALTGFVAGWTLRGPLGLRPASAVTPPVRPVPGPAGLDRHTPSVAADPQSDELDTLFESGDWSDAVLAVASRWRRDEERARQRLHAELDLLVQAGRNDAAAGLADAILTYYARDAHVLLVQANLLQQLGQARAAVAPLYEVIQYAGSAEQVQLARTRLRVLVDALIASMAQRGETGALLELLDELLLQDPGNPRWRLLAARWHFRNGDRDVARAHLDQLAPGVALSDAVRASVNELRLEMASGSGLPLTRRGSHWVASVRLGRVAAELMVDTGASMTVLTLPVLQAAGARPLGRSVRINTAGGPVAAALYEIDSLVAGPHVFEHLTVAALADDLPADGLLGMDVLSQVGLDLAADSAISP